MNETVAKALFVMVGFTIGALFTCQAGVNAHLKSHLSVPIQAAFVSFFTGTLVLSILCIGQYFSDGQPWFKGGISSVPWWAWLGGLIGAFNVSFAIFLTPRLGAILLALTIISGQILTAITLEHFGAIGYQRIPLSPHRILGSIMVLLGVLIVLWPFGKAEKLESATQQAQRSLSEGEGEGETDRVRVESWSTDDD